MRFFLSYDVVREVVFEFFKKNLSYLSYDCRTQKNENKKEKADFFNNNTIYILIIYIYS